MEREEMHTHCVLCIKVTRRRMQNGRDSGRAGGKLGFEIRRARLAGENHGL